MLLRNILFSTPAIIAQRHQERSLNNILRLVNSGSSGFCYLANVRT